MFKFIKNLYLRIKSKYLTRKAEIEYYAWKDEIDSISIRCCHCGKLITYKEYKQAPSLIIVDEERPECLSCIAKILSGELYKQ